MCLSQFGMPYVQGGPGRTMAGPQAEETVGTAGAAMVAEALVRTLSVHLQLPTTLLW
jgi:hypothetical protein